MKKVDENIDLGKTFLVHKTKRERVESPEHRRILLNEKKLMRTSSWEKLPVHETKRVGPPKQKSNQTKNFGRFVIQRYWRCFAATAQKIDSPRSNEEQIASPTHFSGQTLRLRSKEKLSRAQNRRSQWHCSHSVQTPSLPNRQPTKNTHAHAKREGGRSLSS